MLLFYKPSRRFIWVNSFTHFWSWVDESFRQSIYFVFRFPARTFLGLVGEAASPPIFILICLSQLASNLRFHCIFLQGAFPIPWPFIKTLRTPIYSLGLPVWFYFSDLFWRRLRSGEQSFWPFPRKLDFSVPSDILGGLCSCFWGFDHQTARLATVIWVLVCPKGSLFSWGYPTFLDRLICDCEQCPGKYSICLLFLSFHYIEDLISPSLWWYFFCSHFSLLCGEDII